MTKTLLGEVRGSSFVWVPAKNVPFKDNVIKITDLEDSEPNFSKRFQIAGGNISWTAPVSIDTAQPTATKPKSAVTETPLSTSPSPTPLPSPAPSGGLSTGVKTGLGIGAAVVAIIVCLLIYLWCRHRREKSRLGNQPMRTMTTDNTPQSSPSSNRHQSVRYSTPTKPEAAARGHRSRSHTLGSTSSTSPFRKLFFSEKTEPLDQVSTGSTLVSNGDPEKGYYSPTSDDSANNGGGNVTWDETTPRNDRNIPSPHGSELDAVHNSRHTTRYGSLGREPESPTPQRRYVSAPIRLETNPQRQTSPVPLQRGQWELSAGTPLPHHSQAAVRSPQELSSTPVLSPQGQAANDPYKDVTFGTSDDPDDIVNHLAAQREKVRAEKERLRRLRELDNEEEEIERRMREARERRLA